MIIADIAAAAASLRERLADGYLPAPGADQARDGGEIAARWALLLSRDDPAALERRLALEGLSPARAIPLLGPVQPSLALPEWTGFFEEVLAEASLIEDWPPADETLPWQGFPLPFVRVARRRLTACFGLSDRFSSRALDELEVTLTRRLDSIAHQALELDWSVAQAVFPGGPAAPDRAAFLRACYRDGHFFSTYPVAARLLSLVAGYWVDAIADLSARLAQDEAELCRKFSGLAAPLRVESCRASLSDPHRCGRTVGILTFANGAKLVYKPRSLGLEAAYFDLVAWLNTRESCGAGQTMRIVGCLDRGDYGWMEWVGREDCSTETELDLYFQRAGSLLALLYALAGSDMHYENIVAHGGQPVPVDLEVLMVPARLIIDESLAGEASMVASFSLLHSVRSVGLLPQWVSVKKGQVHNAGGLGSVDAASDEPGAAPKPGIPRLAGRSISSHLYRSQIIEGFQAMYEFLRRHRKSILAPDGPLTRFRSLPVRMVNRPTNLYARLLRKALSPAALSSGVARSLEFEILFRTVLMAEERWRPGALDTTLDEILALERDDIPFFQGTADSRDLLLAEVGGASPDFFGRTGYEIAQDRFRLLSGEDLALQLRLIRLSFDLIGNTGAPPDPTPPVKPLPVFRPPAFADEIVSLARRLCASSISAGESVTWIAPQLIPGSGNFELRSITDSLYDGTLGVLPFLFAAEKNYGEKESGRVARGVVASFRKGFLRPAYRSILRQGSLGLSGLGGSIYSLLLAADLTGDAEIAALAVGLAELLDDSLIAQDKSLDVLAGVAGLIPALLGLHRRTGDPRWFRHARAGGDRLLAARSLTPSGLRSWKIFDACLSGYSHGAAGIAASLLRLHAATGDERYQAAAGEAISYENTLFAPEMNNWQDLRFGRTGFMNAWCHGAPGIALGRIVGGHDAATLERDIAAALQTTSGSEPNRVDQACCGNAGRADILHLAARRLHRSDYDDAARNLMTRAILDARSHDGYACYGTLPRTVQGPGYFQGLSGIGYTLARLEDPTLPSVLAMELEA